VNNTDLITSKKTSCIISTLTIGLAFKPINLVVRIAKEIRCVSVKVICATNTVSQPVFIFRRERPPRPLYTIKYGVNFQENVSGIKKNGCSLRVELLSFQLSYSLKEISRHQSVIPQKSPAFEITIRASCKTQKKNAHFRRYGSDPACNKYMLSCLLSPRHTISQPTLMIRKPHGSRYRNYRADRLDPRRPFGGGCGWISKKSCGKCATDDKGASQSGEKCTLNESFSHIASACFRKAILA
jgi:hypothetical protein